MDKFNQGIKRPVLYILIGLFVIFLDQLTKWLVLNKARGGFLIFKLLKIEIYKNKGIAFGFSVPYFILLVLVILILVFCFWELRKGFIKKNFLVVLALSLVLGGAISNLIDRICLGYVVDILHFVPTGSMFNLADIVIVAGVGILVWREIKILRY